MVATSYTIDIIKPIRNIYNNIMQVWIDGELIEKIDIGTGIRLTDFLSLKMDKKYWFTNST